MSSRLLLGAFARPCLVPCVRSASASCPQAATSVLSPLEQKYFPHIGNRELVGFGRNGVPSYADDIYFPYPGMRFGKHTPHIAALQEKEKGPWNQLTIEEVKALYRYSFRQTFSEFTSPTGEWKAGLGWACLAMTVGSIIYIILRTTSPWARTYATLGEKTIEGILRKRFPDARLIDVSDVSGGCGAMYQIVVETKDFENIPILAQHRAVKEALKNQIKDMHGLTLSTKP